MITMDKDKHGDKQSNAKKRTKVIMIEKIKPAENELPERKPSRLESAALLTTFRPLVLAALLLSPRLGSPARAREHETRRRGLRG